MPSGPGAVFFAPSLRIARPSSSALTPLSPVHSDGSGGRGGGRGVSSARGKSACNTSPRNSGSSASVVGGVHGLSLFRTILYGRPHGSSSTDWRSSFHAPALALAMFRCNAEHFCLYSVYSWVTIAACTAQRPSFSRARVYRRLVLAASLRKEAISSVHQYTARLAGTEPTRGKPASHTRVINSRNRSAPSSTRRLSSLVAHIRATAAACRAS